MDVDLFERGRARINEAVRGFGFDNDDVARFGWVDVVVENQGGVAFLDEDDFVVGMAVKRRSVAGLGFDEEYGGGGVVVDADEVIGASDEREVQFLEDGHWAMISAA